MLHLLKPRPSVLCDRLSRREWLQVGGLGLLGLTLPRLLQAEQAARAKPGRPRPTADACIMLFLAGGPSHLDMWDMKPAAPREIRGEFAPIATTRPGLHLCEHLPRLAAYARQFALIRSLHHKVSNAHAAATHFALTGEDRGDTNVAVGASPKDLPSIGSVLARFRPPRRAVVPYVSLPYITAEGRGGPPQPGVSAGLLGQAYDPLYVLRDPNAPDFAIPELTLVSDVTPRRLDRRRTLLARVNHHLDALDRLASLRGLDAYQQQAVSLLTSPAVRAAFDLGREDPKVRDRYGRNIYGQSVLLARRLIQSGTRMVCLKWAPDANATWDTHTANFPKLRGELLPQLNAALPSLLQDLIDLGRLDRTLVVVMGEFGRSPLVNRAGGRDHWPRCYSMLLAGGGVAGGRIVGASDRTGAVPADTPLSPHDVIATIYAALGIPTDLMIPDHLNRPIALVGQGRVITESFF